MSESSIIQRHAVRAILLTRAREVLLLRIRSSDCQEPFWIAPGGGLEPGETVAEGLRRGLREELGLDAFSVGPLVWLRQHTFNWDGRRICQREQYHIVDVDRFEPRMSDLTEARVLDQFRWWRARDLADARERLTPLTLATIVANYLRDGAPQAPLAWEVLVD